MLATLLVHPRTYSAARQLVAARVTATSTRSGKLHAMRGGVEATEELVRELHTMSAHAHKGDLLEDMRHAAAALEAGAWGGCVKLVYRWSLRIAWVVCKYRSPLLACIVNC